MSETSPPPSQIADCASHLAAATPIAQENPTDGAWLMYNKSEDRFSDDGPYWLSNSRAAIESIERASSNNQTESRGGWEFSDIFMQHSQLQNKSRNTSVKRSRRSRPLLLKLIDPVIRARGPIAILLLIGLIVAGLFYQSEQFTPSQPIVEERQTAYITPNRPVIHIAKARRIVKRVSPHQPLAMNSHSGDIEILVPASTSLEHRHAYQTYR